MKTTLTVLITLAVVAVLAMGVVYSGTVASGRVDLNALGLGQYTISVSATDGDDDRPNDSASSGPVTRTVTIPDDDAGGPLRIAGLAG